MPREEDSNFDWHSIAKEKRAHKSQYERSFGKTLQTAEELYEDMLANSWRQGQQNCAKRAQEISMTIIMIMSVVKE